MKKLMCWMLVVLMLLCCGSAGAEDFSEFTNGFEKGEFEKYNSNASDNGLGGTPIFITGMLTMTKIQETSEGYDLILGYIQDDANNTWLLLMHAVPFVPENVYSLYEGKNVIVRGYYQGYSGTEQLPAIMMEQMMNAESGETTYGMGMWSDEESNIEGNDDIAAYDVPVKIDDLEELSMEFPANAILNDFNVFTSQIKEFIPDEVDGVTAKEIPMENESSYIMYYDGNGDICGIEISTAMHNDTEKGSADIVNLHSLMYRTIMGEGNEEQSVGIMVEMIEALENEEGILEGEHTAIIGNFSISVSWENQELDLLGNKYTFSYVTLNVKEKSE